METEKANAPGSCVQVQVLRLDRILWNTAKS